MSEFDPIEVTQFSLAELEAIVGVAEDYESYVCVHAYHDRSYTRALDAGVKCFEHGFIVSEETVRRMSETEGVFWSFQAWASYTLLGQGQFPTFFTADQRRKATQAAAGVAQVATWMKKYDVPIVLGSDMFGEDMWPSLVENIISPTTIPDAGYTTVDVMRSSTSIPGRILIDYTGPAQNNYKDGVLGVIAEGAYADLLLHRRSPLDDITALRDDDNLAVIMKDGRVYKNTLDRS